MIEFSGAPRGYPWHGLWRQTSGASAGVITTASGVEIALPDMQPLSDGDCFSVVVPGMPAVTATPEEVAAGKTWLNYALVSGKDALLYGREVGRDRHIYIDGNGRAWRVSVMLSGTRDDQVISAYITVERFGVVGGNVLAPIPPVEVGVTYSTTPAYTHGWLPSDIPVRLDINDKGDKLLVGAPRTVGYAAVAEIALSGSPIDGDFGAAMTLLWDETHVDVWSGGAVGGILYIWSPLEEVDGEWVRVGPYTSSEYPDLDGASGSSVGLISWVTSMSSSRRHIAGARYSAAGEAQLCRYEMDFSWSMTPSLPAGIPCSAAQDVVEHVRVAVVCGADSSAILVTQTQHGHGTLFAGEGNGFEFAGELVVAGQMTIPVFSTRGRAAVGSMSILASSLMEPSPSRLVGARLSNSLYAATSPGIIQHPSQPGDVVWDLDSAIIGPLIGRVGSTSTTIQVDEVIDDQPVFFAAEQPVTGDIATSTEGVVCWI